MTNGGSNKNEISEKRIIPSHQGKVNSEASLCLGEIR